MQSFHHFYKGRTFLVAGNGPNLALTPPQDFGDAISIGMNTIHRHPTWQPDLYTAVDRRVAQEYGPDIIQKLGHIPKFIPQRLHFWQGENLFLFPHRSGSLWHPENDGSIWQDNPFTSEVSYANVMHVAIKLAYFMGASTILIIGMQHRPTDARAHFWGTDEGMPEEVPLQDWFKGYQQLAEGLKGNGVTILNISPETCVPEEILPRDTYTNWR